MKKSVILWGFFALPLAILGQDSNNHKFNIQPYAIKIAPFALLEPAGFIDISAAFNIYNENQIEIGVGAYFLDNEDLWIPNYVGFKPHNYKIRLVYNKLLKTSKSEKVKFYFSPEIYYKQIFYDYGNACTKWERDSTEEWYSPFAYNCLSRASEPYYEVDRVLGAHFKYNIVFYIKHKWLLEIWGGLGIKYINRIKTVGNTGAGDPHADLSENQPIPFWIYDDERGISIALPIGVRVGFRL